MAANYEAASDRYERIGAIIGRGESTPAEKVAVFRRALGGVTETLAEVGVREDAIPALAEAAYNDPCMVTNPRSLTCDEIERIYMHAF